MSHQNYLARYVEFLKKKAKAKGYDFHEIWPPVVRPQSGDQAPSNSSEKLPWWSLARRKHLKKVREERDRRQQEILRLRS
jgi:hypothetical protein